MPQKPAGEPMLLSRALSTIIRMQLTKAGLTQIQLAKEIGKSKGYVSERLNDDSQWTTNDIEMIADALDMDAYQLMHQALEERRNYCAQVATRGVYQTFNGDAERSRRIADRAAAVPQQNYTWG